MDDILELKNEYYYNRELSWLDFNYRVLREAWEKSTPLLERVKFLGITASNLDEFFMVRISTTYNAVLSKVIEEKDKIDLTGYEPEECLKAVLNKTREFMNGQYKVFDDLFRNELKSRGIILLESHTELNDEQASFVDKLFEAKIKKELAFDKFINGKGREKNIRNSRHNIAVTMDNDQNIEFINVAIPTDLERVIEVPAVDNKRYFILLEQVVLRNIFKIYRDESNVEAYIYRILRNADFEIDETSKNYINDIEEKVKARKYGDVVRFEIDANVDRGLLSLLKIYFKTSSEKVYKINGIIDFTFCFDFYKKFENEMLVMDETGNRVTEKLKYDEFIPRLPEDFDRESIFKRIKEKNIMLFHPYEAFDPVVWMIKEAAADPNTIAIKQTLYRVSKDSPVVKALVKAAEAGKTVVVLVEVKARFDEKNNIKVARKLEKAGCIVIYGYSGLEKCKVHSKVTLVIKRSMNGDVPHIERYAHFGTGNYNEETAKVYSDISYMTADEEMCEDAAQLFNVLSGSVEKSDVKMKKLLTAPDTLKQSLLLMIKNEKANAILGKNANIVFKVNSICDKEIIDALYDAAKAGVIVDLIVRGICCIKPDVSDNIQIRSIIGRYLEHSRIYYFYNNGKEDIFMGSADLMPRNLDKRVEVVFPVIDEESKNKAKEILQVQLHDNIRAHVLNENGHFIKKNGNNTVDSQEYFISKNSTEEV